MKHTTHSEQELEKWEHEFEAIVGEELVFGDPTLDPRGFYKCRDFIKHLIQSEREKVLKEELAWIKKISVKSARQGVLGYDFVHRYEARLEEILAKLAQKEESK